MTPIYISDYEALKACCDALVGAQTIALDTEFEHRNTWRGRLSLVQMYAGATPVLIDTPVIDDLSPLRDLFVSYRGECLMYSPDQDLDILKRHCGAAPEPVYDVQLAAAFLGFGLQISYSRLVQDILGVELDKSQQTSDWMRRPLSDLQKIYAANDVYYLPPVWEELRRRLDDAGRRSWYEEEIDAWRRRLREKECAEPCDAQSAMLEWREQEAERLDVPANWVLHKRQLSKLMRLRNPDIEGVAAIVAEHRIRRSAKQVLRAFLECKERFPERRRRVKVPKELVDRAMADVAEIAKRHNVDSSLLFGRRRLTDFFQNPESDLSGWRAELLSPVLSPMRRK